MRGRALVIGIIAPAIALAWPLAATAHTHGPEGLSVREHLTSQAAMLEPMQRKPKSADPLHPAAPTRAECAKIKDPTAKRKCYDKQPPPK